MTNTIECISGCGTATSDHPRPAISQAPASPTTTWEPGGSQLQQCFVFHYLTTTSTRCTKLSGFPQCHHCISMKLRWFLPAGDSTASYSLQANHIRLQNPYYGGHNVHYRAPNRSTTARNVEMSLGRKLANSHEMSSNWPKKPG